MTVDRWSPQAREWLTARQSEVYANLGVRAGLGNDPMTAFLHFGTDRMPADWISPEKYETTFKGTWGGAEGWGGQREQIAGYLARYHTVPLPTPFEDPNRYPTLLEMADAIESTVALVRPLGVKPLLGTLPSGEINARAVYLRSTREHLVLFEHGLFAFAFEISKLLASTFPPLAPAGARVRFAAAPNPAVADPDLIGRFVEILKAYVVHGNPARVPHAFFDPSKMTAAMLLLRSMEMFILAHEYAHIFMGHLTDEVPAAGSGIDEVDWNWDQELEADEVGFSLMARTLQDQGVPLPLCYWGTEAFFGSMAILEKCRSLLQGGPEDGERGSPTHPPMTARRDRLRKILPQLVTPDESAEALALGRGIQATLDVLWQASLPQWRAMHAGGVKPSPLWG